jgi:hypothetical protein
MSQTSVLSGPPIALPGDIGDFHTATDAQINSRHNAESSASIIVGCAVKRHATIRDGALRVAATADKATIDGILVRAQAYSEKEIEQIAVGTAINMDAMKIDSLFDVGKTGTYAVMITEDVTIGSAVRLRCVAATNEPAGSFRTTQATTTCLLLPTDAFYWVTAGVVDTALGYGVAMLHVDFNHIVRAVADT